MFILYYVKLIIEGYGFINCEQDNKVTGRKADVIIAAQNAAEIALRLVKAGNEVLSRLLYEYLFI